MNSKLLKRRRWKKRQEKKKKTIDSRDEEDGKVRGGVRGSKGENLREEGEEGQEYQ